MYYAKYAPWDHYPKTLSHAEIVNPLKVLDDFFSVADLEQHRKDLAHWRKCVITKKGYNKKRNTPNNLLFFHEQNSRLMEAVHLLLLSYKINSWRIKPVLEDQLTEEKLSWHFQAEFLTPEEMKDPFLAVKKLFKKIKPQMYRDYLAEWLDSALRVKMVDASMIPGEVIMVYENLQKLYDVAWLIFKRSNNGSFIAAEQIKKITNQSGKIFDIKELFAKMTKAEDLALAELQAVILKAIPTVEMIISLAVRYNPEIFYLLILVGEDEKMPEVNIGNKIEDSCRPLANVFAIVHKSASAQTGLQIGERFWLNAINNGAVIYNKSDLELLPIDKLKLNDANRAKFHWDRWGTQGKEFYKGAEFYNSIDNHRLAAFMLHQAVESTLKAIIQAIVGYRVQSHNLSRLLNLSRLFTDDLVDLFLLQADGGKANFIVLQNAYSHSRYKNDYDPDGEIVQVLSHKVSAFIKRVEMIYTQYITKIEIQPE